MLKGNDLILSIDGVKLASSKSCGVERNVDTIEVCSPVDGAAKRFIPTTTSWSISAGGLYADRAGAERLRNIWRAYQKGESTPLHVSVTTEGKPEGGEAILTSLQEQCNVNELVKFSIQLQGSGPLEKIGVPIELHAGLNQAGISILGPNAIIKVVRGKVEYADINVSNPFVMKFTKVDNWMILPGNHLDWQTDLKTYDSNENMFNARVGYGWEGISSQFAAGSYVLYTCYGNETSEVRLIEE